MAETLEHHHGIKPRLVKGSGGIFEVAYGGDLIFSKRVLHRFPEPGEVERLLRDKLGEATS